DAAARPPAHARPRHARRHVPGAARHRLLMAVGTSVREHPPTYADERARVPSPIAARLCVASVVAAVVPVIVSLVRALHDACLPWAVLVASLIVETHLSYAVLVPVLGLWGVGALAWSVARRRRDEPDRWPDERRRLRRIAVVTGVVVALCWLQPVVEQFTS